ncbi:MAG: hypothetical protein JOZ57_16890, partial [Abitibacteriaceae bacterium]|nr:hypothetical protein [Abditibacteriaceae bacterium]
QWAGQTWDYVADNAVIPARPEDRQQFFAALAEREAEITHNLQQAADLDAQIDEIVLDLYGITDPQWRARVLNAAPPEEAEEENDDSNILKTNKDSEAPAVRDSEVE